MKHKAEFNKETNFWEIAYYRYDYGSSVKRLPMQFERESIAKEIATWLDESQKAIYAEVEAEFTEDLGMTVAEAKLVIERYNELKALADKMKLFQPKYDGLFLSRETLIEEFGQIDEDVDIIYACFLGARFYDGEAYVLFHQAGKVYTVCAWYDRDWGLHSKWEAEETTLQSVIDQIKAGTLARKTDTFNLYHTVLKFAESKEILREIRR